MSKNSGTWTHASTEERIERLPKWAQDHIRTLEMRAREAEKDAAEWKRRISGPADEDTGVWLDGGWNKPNIPLSKHAFVSFRDADGAVVTVGRGLDNDLELRTVGTLLLAPRATNVARVEVRR